MMASPLVRASRGPPTQTPKVRFPPLGSTSYHHGDSDRCDVSHATAARLVGNCPSVPRRPVARNPARYATEPFFNVRCSTARTFSRLPGQKTAAFASALISGHGRCREGNRMRLLFRAPTDSNRRPLPYHGSALPTELRGEAPHVSVPCMAPTIRLAERRDAAIIRDIYNVELAASTVTFDMVPRTLGGAGGLDRPALRWTPGDRGRGRRRGRRVRVALAVQGPSGVLDDGRGLRLRGSGPPRRGSRAEPCSKSSSAGARPRIPLGDRPDRRRSRCVDRDACRVRLRDVGVEREVGRKFNHWLDVVEMQTFL